MTPRINPAATSSTVFGKAVRTRSATGRRKEIETPRSPERKLPSQIRY
jgi:hypothetical protein